MRNRGHGAQFKHKRMMAFQPQFAQARTNQPVSGQRQAPKRWFPRQKPDLGIAAPPDAVPLELPAPGTHSSHARVRPAGHPPRLASWDDKLVPPRLGWETEFPPTRLTDGFRAVRYEAGRSSLRELGLGLGFLWAGTPRWLVEKRPTPSLASWELHQKIPVSAPPLPRAETRDESSTPS